MAPGRIDVITVISGVDIGEAWATRESSLLGGDDRQGGAGENQADDLHPCRRAGQERRSTSGLRG